jgi:predicted enzyme related to lactoylglutathione lyase
MLYRIRPMYLPKDNRSLVMTIHYLEIVTQDVEAVCASYARVQGVKFGEAVAALGGARTAEMPAGGLLGVRAPMHDAELPVVRPYLLVEDIAAAVAAAEASGGQIALPAMEIPGHGTIAIFMLGDIQHGLWQV